MYETLIKKQFVTKKTVTLGIITLERYNGSEGIYRIKFTPYGEYEVPRKLCTRINLMHDQYRELSRNRKHLYGQASVDSIILEVKNPGYQKFYEQIKKMLISYYK